MSIRDSKLIINMIKKYETTKGVAKMSGTLAGAAAGSMILPGIGTIFGGIGGYLLGKFGGEKAAEKSSRRL